MTRHFFETVHEGVRTLITMGWDHIQQDFFMTIEKEDGVENPFWSSATDLHDPHPRSLKSFIAVFDEIGIAVPQFMLNEVFQ